MRLLPYFNKRSSMFAQKGIQDKLLTTDGIRYLLFFESDEPFRELESYNMSFPFRMFHTRNGFHIVGFGVHTAKEKIIFYEQWKALYPKTDYFMYKSVLRPHSQQELEFIVNQAFSVQLVTEPLLCVYYRDKAVFENYFNNRI